MFFQLLRQNQQQIRKNLVTKYFLIWGYKLISSHNKNINIKKSLYANGRTSGKRSTNLDTSVPYPEMLGYGALISLNAE